MKNTLLGVSMFALLLSLLAAWEVLTGNGNPSLMLWVSWGLALVVGILSAVYAVCLGRSVWSVGLALVTLFIIGSGGVALADLMAHPDGFFPTAFEAGAVPITMTFAEVLPPLIALLSALLLRPGRQKAGVSTAFAARHCDEVSRHRDHCHCRWDNRVRRRCSIPAWSRAL